MSRGNRRTDGVAFPSPGFRVQDSGFRVQGSGFRVQGHMRAIGVAPNGAPRAGDRWFGLTPYTW